MASKTKYEVCTLCTYARVYESEDETIKFKLLMDKIGDEPCDDFEPISYDVDTGLYQYRYKLHGDRLCYYFTPYRRVVLMYHSETVDLLVDAIKEHYGITYVPNRLEKIPYGVLLNEFSRLVDSDIPKELKNSLTSYQRAYIASMRNVEDRVKEKITGEGNEYEFLTDITLTKTV